MVKRRVPPQIAAIERPGFPDIKSSVSLKIEEGVKNIDTLLGIIEEEKAVLAEKDVDMRVYLEELAKESADIKVKLAGIQKNGVPIEQARAVLESFERDAEALRQKYRDLKSKAVTSGVPIVETVRKVGPPPLPSDSLPLATRVEAIAPAPVSPRRSPVRPVEALTAIRPTVPSDTHTRYDANVFGRDETANKAAVSPRRREARSVFEPTSADISSLEIDEGDVFPGTEAARPIVGSREELMEKLFNADTNGPDRASIAEALTEDAVFRKDRNLIYHLVFKAEKNGFDDFFAEFKEGLNDVYGLDVDTMDEIEAKIVAEQDLTPEEAEFIQFYATVNSTYFDDHDLLLRAQSIIRDTALSNRVSEPAEAVVEPPVEPKEEVVPQLQKKGFFRKARNLIGGTLVAALSLLGVKSLFDKDSGGDIPKNAEIHADVMDYPTAMDRTMKAVFDIHEVQDLEELKKKDPGAYEAEEKLIAKFKDQLYIARARAIPPADKVQEGAYVRFQTEHIPAVGKIFDEKNLPRPLVSLVLAWAYRTGDLQLIHLQKYIDTLSNFDKHPEPMVALLAAQFPDEAKFEEVWRKMGMNKMSHDTEGVKFVTRVANPLKGVDLGPEYAKTLEIIGLTLSAKTETSSTTRTSTPAPAASPSGEFSVVVKGREIGRIQTATAAPMREEARVESKQTPDTRFIYVFNADSGKYEGVRGSVDTWVASVTTQLNELKGKIASGTIESRPQIEAMEQALVISFGRSFSKFTGYQASEPSTFVPYTPGEFAQFAAVGKEILGVDDAIKATGASGLTPELRQEIEKLVKGAEKNEVQMSWQVEQDRRASRAAALGDKKKLKKTQ